jgi:hypothetical protein
MGNKKIELTEEQEKLYREDPYFHNSIIALEHGGDAVAIIEQLCKANNELGERIRYYAERHIPDHQIPTWLEFIEKTTQNDGK